MDKMGSNDNREHMRMRINTHISFSVRGSNELFSGICTDLSHSGARFETQVPLSRGTVIDAVIDPGTPGCSPLCLALVVVRAEPAGADSFEISGETIEIDGIEREIK